MFRYTKSGNIPYLESGKLSALGFLCHAFCTRRGGVSAAPYDSLNAGDLVGDREEAVTGNLARIGQAFSVPQGQLVVMRQVHGDRIQVIRAGEPLPEGIPECDGLITDQAGLTLGIRTADCVPLFFVDRVLQVIGVAHAGWRGTALGVASRMVDAFAKWFDTRPKDLLVAIGPSIGPCCYEVDGPVRSAFSADPMAVRFFNPSPKQERWTMDLSLANGLQIQKKGVPAENIDLSSLCTSCRRDLFFSHRAAGGHTGRQISVITLGAERRDK